MKKLLLLLVSGTLSIATIAQTQTIKSNAVPAKMGTALQQVTTGRMEQLAKNSPAAPHFGHDSKKLIPGISTYNDWYDLWDQNYVTGGLASSYFLTLYPDSTLIDDYAGGTAYTFIHGVGMSFDPTDSGYTYNALTYGVSHPLPPTGQGYTIDSFYVPIQYLRNNASATVVDSVIIEIVVTSNVPLLDSGSYELNYSYNPTYYPITYDAMPRFGDMHYNNGLVAPYNVNPYINDCYFDSIRTRKYRYALPMTNANKYDTAANGCILLNQAGHSAVLPLSPAIPVYSSNTHAVSYISFKSGATYAFGTHTSHANVIHCYTGEPNGLSTWFMQSAGNASLVPVYPGSFQAGLYATNQIKYDNASYAFDGHNILVPGFAFAAPGFSVPFDQWHITWTCTTPGVGAITGPSNVCYSATITLSDTASGGTWSASNGHATVSGGGVVTGVTSGVDTITYTVTNTCGAATATKTITVNPVLSPGIITGPSIVCTSATITLSDTATGGTWSATNGKATVVGGIVTGVTAGTDTIAYTVSNICGTFGITKIITIAAAPVAGSITGATAVCVGSTITLTDAATGGAWTTALGNATVSAGVVTGVTAGVDTVKYSVTTACATAVAKSIVTINPLPVPVITITGITTLGTSGTYATYQWNVGGGAITGATNSTYTVLLLGSYSVTVEDVNGCTGTSTVAIVDPAALGLQNMNGAANTVTVYPNPAQSLVNIAASVKVNIQLTTMDGKVIMEKQNAKTIDISNLPNGNYMLNVYDAGSNLKLKTERVVKLAN